MGLCQDGKLAQALASRVFPGALPLLPIWPPVCGPSRGKVDMEWPKTHNVNHTVRLSGGQGSPGKELSGETFQGLRVQLPLAKGKGQASIWVRLILHYTIMFGRFLHIFAGSWSLPIFLLLRIWQLKTASLWTFGYIMLVHVPEFLLGTYA